MAGLITTLRYITKKPYKSFPKAKNYKTLNYLIYFLGSVEMLLDFDK